MEIFLRIYRIYGRLVSMMAVIAGTATFAMMWLVDANVLSRKFFNMPVMGSVEISQALLVFCIMLGLAYAQATGAHLRVTVLTERFSYGMNTALFTIAMICGFVLFATLARSSFGFAVRSYNIGEQVWGASVRFPLWPVKAAIPFGAALLSIQFLLDAIRVGVFGHVAEHDDISSSNISAHHHD